MWDPFEIDEDNPPQPKSPLKERENHFTDKFTKTMTKNFMHESTSKQEQYHEQPPQGLTKEKYETLRERRKNTRINSKILKPYSNAENSEKLQELKLNVQLNILNFEEDEDIQEVSSPMKRQPQSPEPLISKKKIEERPIKLQEVEMPERKESNILFYDDEESQVNQPHVEQVCFPIHNQLPHYLQDIDMNSVSSVMDNVIIRSYSQYFNVQNKQQLQKQIFDIVKPLHTLKMHLCRNNSGFNTFWPEFHLKFCQHEEPSIINAKRKTARPISTYILSTSETDYEENSPSYLGKIKSSALGDILYIFGPGYSPSNAKEKKLEQREMIATIRYQSNFFNTGKPREFELFTLKEGVKYFNLKGTKLYGQQPGLDQLFNHEVNRDMMYLYCNRKPIWNDQIGGFMLNFKGRVPCASIKNFILDDPFGHEAMMFGRKESNQFAIEITDKISPYIAMAVALSAFDTRVMCE